MLHITCRTYIHYLGTEYGVRSTYIHTEQGSTEYYSATMTPLATDNSGCCSRARVTARATATCAWEYPVAGLYSTCVRSTPYGVMGTGTCFLCRCRCRCRCRCPCLICASPARFGLRCLRSVQPGSLRSYTISSSTAHHCDCHYSVLLVAARPNLCTYIVHPSIPRSRSSSYGGLGYHKGARVLTPGTPW